MLAVRWTADALAQLDTVTTYVQARNFGAAERLRLLFEEAAERLPLDPYSCRPGRVPGTREVVVHPNYVPYIAWVPRRSTSSRFSTLASNIPDLGIRAGAR